MNNKEKKTVKGSTRLVIQCGKGEERRNEREAKPILMVGLCSRWTDGQTVMTDKPTDGQTPD